MAAAGSALMSVNEGDENSLFYDDPDLAVDDYIPKDRHDLELMRERLSKLLLGDDPSGGAKGCGPALAMANAITSVSASVFGDSLRLRPLRDEDKNKWRREMGIMVSVCRHIVELAPGWQTRPDGTRFEVMKRRVREDLRINLPALTKLDHLLQSILEQSTSNEYYYEDEVVGGQEPREEDEEEGEEEREEDDDVDVDDDDVDGDIVDQDFDLNADVAGGSEGGVGSERGGIGSEEGGVGLEKGSAAAGGGSEVTKGSSAKEAFSRREGGRSSRGDSGASGGSGLSGLRGGNASSNSGEDQEQQEERQQQEEEPEKHESDAEGLEQQFRRSISAPTERRESGDFAEVDKETWTFQIPSCNDFAPELEDNTGRQGADDQHREPYLTHTLGGSYLSTSSREIMRLEENLERVASCLAAIRRMWPDLPQTTLDLAKIAFNRDIGKAVLESYSRVLEGAASNIRARLRDVLHADHLFNNPQLFPLQDAPSDPRPQHLRHPTFSLLMPDTIFDAVSVSGGSESSASIRSFESSRSGSSGKGGRHFRGGSMVSDSGVSSPGGGGGGSGGSGGISGGKSGGGRWDTRPPRSPELRTSSVAPAGMSRLGGNGSGGNGSSGMSFRDRFRSATLAAPTSSAAAATTAGAAADAAGGAAGGAAAAGPGSGAMGYSQSLPAHDPKQQQQQPYLRRTGSFQPTSQSRGGMMRTVRRSQSGGLEEEVMRLKLESGETGGDSPVLTKTPGFVLVSALQSGGGGGGSGGFSSRPPHPPNRSASGDWT
ncbi:unnamed protein product [Closterium sp. Naga37s-1]|nr:unnamed protein product [Closterium sp. Naga37s-1]